VLLGCYFVKTRDERLNVAVAHLSKRTIDKLTCPKGKNIELVFDDELHGFGVAAYPTGEKSFFVMYGPSHRRRKMTIAKYGVITCEQARVLAREELSRANKGEDPAELKRMQKSIPTFAK